MTTETELMIGIDIGGSNARIALVEQDRIVAERRLLTGREQSAESVSEQLTLAVHALIETAGARVVRGVGIGVAGQIDPATGVVRYAPNLDWHDFPLRQHLVTGVHRPVAVLNDVQAAAYGEWRYGSARGVSDAVALFVGTGVGGGIISGGALVRGCDGSAGEFGHTVLQLDGPLCRCGKHGCLEAFVGGWAVARRARETVAAYPDRGAYLMKLAGNAPENLTAELLARGAAENDPLASSLVQEIGQALGAGIASIANAFNPCAVVLGGGVIEGIPALLGIAEAAARERALPPAVRSLRILAAGLRGYAGVVGAAAWAEQH